MNLKVYHSVDEFPSIRNPVITVGTFDGVHHGHQKIITGLIDAGKQQNGESVILTFFPHPRMVLFPDDNDLKLLNTLNEKISLLEKLGIDHLIIHPFTKDFSRMTATEFIRDILVNKLKIKKIVIGYNHQFGRNREGTFEQLTELSTLHHFEVEEIPEQDVNNIAVSSTKIREALHQGDISVANQLLGYEFLLFGKVVKGDGIGAKLGFPTANVSVPEDYKIVPSEGIYAVKIFIGQREFMGMMYIGKRPVVKGKSLVLEVNIFDFNELIYGQTISIKFVGKIRDDIAFDNLDQLKVQMNKDKINAIKLLK